MTDQELCEALNLPEELENDFFLFLINSNEEDWVQDMNAWIEKNTDSDIRVTAAIDAEDFIEWEI